MEDVLNKVADLQDELKKYFQAYDVVLRVTVDDEFVRVKAYERGFTPTDEGELSEILGVM